ncbi:hypothetical protein DICPUDRAFT_149843 [Dictyostelium purpureum]|uniref:Uncharacterized protein n=1 Tax=Dictyostelium purpureum TaxID=5786 RepID=F0ZET0_DICPU|nr:uncharacterized protein DICPUDRAFT_149843 [Dictyostelium purpureum]EGC37547.1 hypothetical protein DICPUDRAFT_149843 [Dictyostelium purpureum]|eukprot:XP_003285938.1 hypothetical protein DICPUDRAFT_149843 [Dictyostelium purpureum]
MVLKLFPSSKDELITSIKNYFPSYSLKEVSSEHIMPDERIPIVPTLLLSFQHVLAMFGSNVLCPILMGFPVNSALFFSGIGTIIFYICTGGKVPSYLGSSFAFIGAITTASGYVYTPGAGPNPHIALASGGVMVCGFAYLGISMIVILVGYKWLEYLTPPVVTGSVIISIGLNLASSAIAQASSSAFDAWMAFVTVMVVVLVTCYAPGPLRRLPILIGGLTSYLIYLFCGLANVGPGIDFSGVKDTKWIGLPPTVLPEFSGSYISLIAPVAIILAAENIGHLKAVGSMTGNSVDHLLGRAFLGDSIACIIAGLCGSTGTTTYAENIGVMSITKIYSTLSFLFAALFAIILGLLPMFGKIVATIPEGTFGGLSIVLFGITALTGAKLWITDNVDFTKPRNLLTAGVSVVLGSGMVNVVVQFGTIKIDGIGCSTFSAIFLYQLLREDWGDVFRKLTGRGRNLEMVDDFDPSVQYNKNQLLKPLLDNEYLETQFNEEANEFL